MVIRAWNDTAWPHAMHLHGHHFWVDSSEFGEKKRALLQDTYLMQPGEKAELVFIANNPGAWLFSLPYAGASRSWNGWSNLYFIERNP